MSRHAADDPGTAVRRLVRWLVTGWVRPGWLVPLQGAAMVGHLLPGGPAVRLPAAVRAAGVVGLAGGIALSTASATSLGSELTPATTPREGAQLRTEGPYALSRHPLYAGLLVASLGAVLLRGRLSTVVSAVGLAAVLHVKALEEDRALAGLFGERYEAYRARVPRLLGLPGR
ncbi:methyltransferase family protein [Aquipuribacter hungaricus]|uniref:Methyltransferase family protein n=1 Tax=Aquipuribacter hungaricus TaxID=545624 RepID=A0ABV7WAI4_9MICO